MICVQETRLKNVNQNLLRRAMDVISSHFVHFYSIEFKSCFIHLLCLYYSHHATVLWADL
jgi:hypothetical protein